MLMVHGGKPAVVCRPAPRINAFVSIRRLSLNERGLDSADSVIRQLNGIAGGLDEQRQRFEQLATIATADRLAEEWADTGRSVATS